MPARLFGSEGDRSKFPSRQRTRLSRAPNIPARRLVMSRNFLLLLVGVLTVCAVGAGYLYYQERQSGIEIQIDEKGLTIEGN